MVSMTVCGDDGGELACAVSLDLVCDPLHVGTASDLAIRERHGAEVDEEVLCAGRVVEGKQKAVAEPDVVGSDRQRGRGGGHYQSSRGARGGFSARWRCRRAIRTDVDAPSSK